MRSSAFSAEDLINPSPVQTKNRSIDRSPRRPSACQHGRKPHRRHRREEEVERPRKRLRTRSAVEFYSGSNLERIHLRHQEEYINLKKLGTGGQDTAHLLKALGSTFWRNVCKVILKTNYYRNRCEEFFFLRGTLPRNPHIINLQSALLSSVQTNLYLEYYSSCDHDAFTLKYHKHTRPILESLLWHLFFQLSEALTSIHHGRDHKFLNKRPKSWRSVIHRDIKPANILLQRAPRDLDHPGPEPYPRIVLADFGLAA
ncbi:MAG: hypothetical protein Q9181_007329 [Wetmoreana brouardii]